MIRRALALRARRPEAFVGGAYHPIPAGDGIVAFTRGEGEVLVAVAIREEIDDDATLRLPAELTGGWRDVLAGRGAESRGLDLTVDVPFAEIRLPAWPIALLERA